MTYNELIKKYPQYAEQLEEHAAKLEYMAGYERSAAEKEAVRRIMKAKEIREQGDLFD